MPSIADTKPSSRQILDYTGLNTMIQTTRAHLTHQSDISYEQADSNTAREHLINHKSMINIQQSESINPSEQYEEFEDNVDDVNNEEIAPADAEAISNSASSTERALKEHQEKLRGSQQTFGNKMSAGYGDDNTSEDDNIQKERPYQQALTQKEQEIKMLWNVISHLKNGNSTLKSEKYGGKFNNH